LDWIGFGSKDREEVLRLVNEGGLMPVANNVWEEGILETVEMEGQGRVENRSGREETRR
jgi:hypothetical protein